MVLLKKIPNYLINKFMSYFFYNSPKYGLKILFFFKIDIYLYSIPLFISNNISQFKRLYKLKREGKNPKIVLWNKEGDGRFDRISKFAEANNDERSVWFMFKTQVVSAESIIFNSYNKKGCGFYEDSRQKYILPDNYNNRINYRKYLHKLFNFLEIFTGKINYFLAGSNNDRYVIEFIYVLQERGGSSIICEREGTGCDFTYKNEAICFKTSQSIQAHYIFTANEKHREMFEYSKLPSVKVVKALGELDTDFWFYWDRKFKHKFYKKWNKYDKKILFLTFGNRNYIETYLYPQYPDLNWNTLLADSEDVIFNFAKENPNVLIFYKMGHFEDHNHNFMEKCRTEQLNNIVPLDRSFSCNELILYSDLIIGFQTTAIFESMFSDKTIFFLYWAIPDILNPETQILPIANSGACKVIRSKQQFYEYLRLWKKGDSELLPSNEELEKRVLTREIMFQDADGKVAERYFLELNKLFEGKALI